LRTSIAIGVPSVRPSSTPDTISTWSSSRRWLTSAPLRPAAIELALMSSTASSIRGGSRRRPRRARAVDSPERGHAEQVTERSAHGRTYRYKPRRSDRLSSQHRSPWRCCVDRVPAAEPPRQRRRRTLSWASSRRPITASPGSGSAVAARRRRHRVHRRRGLRVGDLRGRGLRRRAGALRAMNLYVRSPLAAADGNT
jgi:hypothetical protein